MPGAAGRSPAISKGHAVRKLLIETSLNRPRLVIIINVLITLAFLSQLPRIRIDTDPENMLPESEPVRVFHQELKETFEIRDFLEGWKALRLLDGLEPFEALAGVQPALADGEPGDPSASAPAPRVRKRSELAARRTCRERFVNA